MRTMRYIAARARSAPPVRSKALLRPRSEPPVRSKSLLQPRSQPLVRSKSPHRPRSEPPVCSKLPLQPRSEPLVRSKSPLQPHSELPMRSCALLWHAHNSLRAQSSSSKTRTLLRSKWRLKDCRALLCFALYHLALLDFAPCMYIRGLALVYIYINIYIYIYMTPHFYSPLGWLLVYIYIY